MQSGSDSASFPDSLSPVENPEAMNVCTKLAPCGPASTRLERTLFNVAHGSGSAAGGAEGGGAVCAVSVVAENGARARAASRKRLGRFMAVALIGGPPWNLVVPNKGG